MESTTEFDAFGPWILPVHDPLDVPRLFRGHWIDFATARLVLKVPRSVWRRDANPNMDLYDHLLVAGPDSLTVLSRYGGGFGIVEVPYVRISAVHNSAAFLDGRLVVRDVACPWPGGAGIDLKYNAVSSDLIDQLVRVVRSAALAAAPQRYATLPVYLTHGPIASRDLGDADVALVAKLHDLAVRDDRAPTALAAHARARVVGRGGQFRRIRDSMRPATLHAAIVYASPGELHCVHRREWITDGENAVHSIAHSVVFVPQVTSVNVNPSPHYAGVQVAEIGSWNSAIEIAFPDGAYTGAAVKGAIEAMSMAQSGY